MGKEKYGLANKYYKSQEIHHGSDYVKGVKRTAKPWLLDGTIDSWRHARMYAFTDPITSVFKKASWLTVGDGKYGRDAHYLEQQEANVLATDISDVLLKKAKKEGYVEKYKKENAECLTFKDNSFDFVLCKESYHHFPRPIVALYEMIRVAKKAVILIEPNDVQTRGVSWKRFFSVDSLGTRVNRFEPSGKLCIYAFKA